MLLIGANVTGTDKPCVSLEEERTQMAVWSLTASPLIMGNDVRSVKPASAAVLVRRRRKAAHRLPAAARTAAHALAA